MAFSGGFGGGFGQNNTSNSSGSGFGGFGQNKPNTGMQPFSNLAATMHRATSHHRHLLPRYFHPANACTFQDLAASVAATLPTITQAVAFLALRAIVMPLQVPDLEVG